MNKQSSPDEHINMLLNLISDGNHEDIGFQQLEKYLFKSKMPIECCYIILKKLLKDPFIKYAGNNLFKIYNFLFNQMKNIKLNFDNGIFFSIIDSLFKFPKANEINKTDYIIKIIINEKMFILKNFDKLLNKIIIPLIIKNEEPIKNIGYYLDQIVKDGIGSIFQENIGNDIEKNNDELNKEFNLIYNYLIINLKEVKILPQIQILYITWFNFLETLPEKDLSQHYYDIIIQLLNVIDSENKEVSELSELYLKKIIDVIIFSYDDKKWNSLDIINNIINLIINDKSRIKKKEPYKIILFEILDKFLEKFKEKLMIRRKNSDDILSENIPFELFPNILNYILASLFDLNKTHNILEQNENSIIYPIIKANIIFIDIIKNSKPEFFKISSFEDVINMELLNYLDENCTNIAFDWINLLYHQQLFQDDEFIKNLIIEMKDLKDFQIKRIIQMINVIKLKSEEFNREIITKFFRKFYDEKILDEFGFLILNQLSDESNKTIDIIDIFKEIINYLKKPKNIYFVLDIIDFLTMYLISEKRANKIINSFNSDKIFFKSLYELFCFNPFNTLVLLLLAKKFELSYFFVLNLSKMDIDNSDYIELSKCVQIFESIYFIDVRIQLLNPKSNIYLTKTMYAISLLLPPGPALDSLKQRLKCLEILFKFDEEESETKMENENENDDINNDDSSKISDFDFNNDSLTLKEDENFKEILNYMDEKDRNVFEKKEIKELINIFYKRQKIRKNEEEKNRKNELLELSSDSF